ncbi:hypothetical protein [Bdellovibrio svalbardensis]|uniref:Uncharacterized protein n=1 Tax=Bdellovibrio svalbardensis TaxID=2972972 RepID=A0ABT6DF30_9BACT|nr:hypothetical protein [Bdellovibrio svalbardensis]MDG0815442.1 hypothetical protein [Bdellovibrio svalbardensis]
MRFALLMLLCFAPQLGFSAASDVQNMSTYDPAVELRRAPASSTRSPNLKACSYYAEGSRVTDITRLQMRRLSCEENQSRDIKLPDRPESDVYRVGEPFDVPKRN